MTEYKTMRVPVTAWQEAREEKREGETWGEFLQRCSNTTPRDVERVSQTVPECDLDQVLSRLDDLESRIPKRVWEEAPR